MRGKVTRKGQVAVPLKVWQKLGLKAGDPVELEFDALRLVITQVKPRRRKARIVTDPQSGHAVLTLGKNAPKLTSAEVRAALADFP